MGSGSDASRFLEEQIESQRLMLRELTVDLMRAIVDGDAAAAAPASPDYPPAGSLVGLRIRLEKAALGRVTGLWFQIVAAGRWRCHRRPQFPRSTERGWRG